MNIAAVLAGGIGQRMGHKTPKQFIEIDGEPIIVKTLKAFNCNNEIDCILVVCLSEWKEELNKAILKYNLNKVKYIVSPGVTRRESSFNAVNAIKDICEEDDIILIHDAARPFVSKDIISENIKKAYEFGACETVIGTHDTIVMSEDGMFSESIPPREKIYSVQTPQSFRYQLILEAHYNYIEKHKEGTYVLEITDDAGLVLFAGKKVALVKGDRLNIKITSPEDLVIYKAIVNNRN